MLTPLWHPLYVGDVYLVETLQCPILSFTGLKKLGLIKEKWPHQEQTVAALSIKKTKKTVVHAQTKMDRNTSKADGMHRDCLVEQGGPDNQLIHGTISPSFRRKSERLIREQPL